MILRDLQHQALEIAKHLPDDEYVRVVRVARRTYTIERGIGVRGDGTVWLVSGKAARKSWYVIGVAPRACG